jgi:hypothetical protein
MITRDQEPGEGGGLLKRSTRLSWGRAKHGTRREDAIYTRSTIVRIECFLNSMYLHLHIRSGVCCELWCEVQLYRRSRGVANKSYSRIQIQEHEESSAANQADHDSR